MCELTDCPDYISLHLALQDRHSEICEQLAKPDCSPADMATLGKELSGLEAVVQLHGELKSLQSEVRRGQGQA